MNTAIPTTTNSQETTQLIFEAQFPYKLSDDHYNRLTQIHGLLEILTELTGNTKPDRSLDCVALHHALWGLHEGLDDVMQSFDKQNKASLDRAVNSQFVGAAR